MCLFKLSSSPAIDICEYRKDIKENNKFIYFNSYNNLTQMEDNINTQVFTYNIYLSDTKKKTITRKNMRKLFTL